ncbi:MAG: hypothetical protein IT438_12215 [Phycisphaerales bacterium]|nr:hypothetical protein [Phycisphaerales bacterium]
MTVIPIVLLAPLTLGSVSLISTKSVAWWTALPLWIGLPTVAIWNARRVSRFRRRLNGTSLMLCPRCRAELRHLDGGVFQCPRCSRRMTRAAVRTSWERFQKL